MACLQASSFRYARALMLAASGLVLAAATARADSGPVAPLFIGGRPQPGTATSNGALLKHLPAGRDELTFRGEMASRHFAVVLGRSEAAQIAAFQVALRNTVSLLPDHSAVTVAINGRTLAVVPATAADKLAVLPVAIPAGLLVPGTNTVQITSTLTHRVDCSVPATYELWATLDPGQTGFIVPQGAIQSIVTVSDLAAAPLADDGTTRIHVRIPEGADEGVIERSAHAVQALVRRARLTRPVVDIGAEPGTGSGFDLVVDGFEPAGLAPLTKTGGIGVSHDPANGRTVVEVASEIADDPHATLDQGVADAAPSRDGFRRTFAQLGKATDVFTGRRYESTLSVVLPPDFISTNDRARLRIDGNHSATLVEGDGLTLRVNGALVSSLPFAAGKAERFNHREVELPLHFFHPGRNDVTIEGIVSAEADAECKTATMPREARLTIAGTSELDMPGFARLTTLPQIPAAMAARSDLPVYLASADRATLGAGLTVLANMAAEGGIVSVPHVHLGTADESAPGLVVTAADQLPPTLSAAVERLTRPATATDATASDANAKEATDDTTLPAGLADGFPVRLANLVDGARTLLRDHGFFFGTDEAAKFELKKDDLLVAAVTPGGSASRSDFDVMPRFAQDATHWLIVTSASSNALDAGMRQLAASGRWADLRGEAAKFDPKAGTLDVRQPQAVTYVLSSDIAVTDVRPILGAMMSDNIVMSVVALLLVMGLLGFSTSAVVRRIGVK